MSSHGSLAWKPQEERDWEAEERAGRVRRCLMGTLLGAGLGLAYGLVSQYINAVAVPSVPFYQPPFGSLGNTALGLAVGALLGLVTAWSDSAFVGILAGCGAGAVLVELVVLLTGQVSTRMMAAKGVLTLFTFLPFAAILIVPIGLLRWVLSKQEDLRDDGAPAWKRILLPLVLLLVAGALGALALFPARGRTVIARMNTIVQAALPAADRSALPAQFRGENIQAIVVPGYPERAKGDYTLDWEKSELSRFAIPRPLDNEWEQSAVIARFEDGWDFVCLFITPDANPRCAEVIHVPISEEE